MKLLIDSNNYSDWLAKLAIITFVFNCLLIPNICNAATAPSWSETETDADRLNVSDSEHARHLVVTKDAVYALDREGKLLKFPFDGSRPTQQTLPGEVVGISVDKNAKLWVLAVEELSRNVFVLTQDKSAKNGDFSAT